MARNGETFQKNVNDLNRLWECQNYCQNLINIKTDKHMIVGSGGKYFRH